MDSFIRYDNWFDAKYKDKPTKRWATMKTALNIVQQRKGLWPFIIETGCAREPDDWGAGMSTLMFSDYCKTYQGKLVTVDNSEIHLNRCKKLTSEFDTSIEYTLSDSVTWLNEHPTTLSIANLVYLDSFDYPYVELLELYGKKDDEAASIKILHGMSEEEIVARHPEIIKASQEHCLEEVRSVLKSCSNRAVILIDDNLPGGGKGRLGKEYLSDNGWTCLLDEYQSLWVKT